MYGQPLRLPHVRRVGLPCVTWATARVARTLGTLLFISHSSAN
jgi:hypothetical protein